MIAIACAGALVMGASRNAAAQAGPPALRLGLETAFEKVTESTASAAAGVSRLHADFSTQRASPRSKVQVWSGLTAEQTWIQASPGALAGAMSVDGGVTLSRRTGFVFSQQVSSAPTDVFAAFGSGTSIATSRAVINGSELPGARRTTSESGRVALTRILGARSQASFTAMQSVSMMGSDRVASAGASASLSRRLGAHVGWHLGYGFTQSTSRTAGSTLDDRRHDLDVGVDYARPLSFSRHTTLSVTSGSSVLTDAEGNHFRVDADVEVSHQLSRHWSAAASYTRPIEYLAGFARPLISDAVRVGFSGTLPHRISLLVSAGSATGTEGSVGGAHFSSYTGSVRISRRLSPVWALEGEYHDGRYRFDEDPQAAGIPAAFARRGFRAGIVWAPGRPARS